MKLYVLDSEDRGPGKCYEIGVYNGKKYWRFDTPKAWRVWALKRKRVNARYYCVNAQYDAGNVFYEVLRQLQFVSNKSRILKVAWKGLALIDTLNYVQASVKDMGKVVKLKKTKLHSKDRCYRDCLITWQFMRGLLDSFKKADVPFKLTIGAMSIGKYKKMGGYLLERRTEAHQIECAEWRPAIHGGRVEVFNYRKQAKAEYADVNAMYVYVMSRGIWPDLNRRRRKGNLEHDGLFNCVVNVRPCDIPILPCRYKGKLLFPIGTFEGCWTTLELRYAVANGARILKVFKSLTYHSMPSPFKRYALMAWNQRKKARNEFAKITWKLLGNNLWGKFSTGNTRPVFHPYDSEDEIPRGAFFYPKTKWYTLDEPSLFPSYASPVWGAYTTAGGRILLHQALVITRDPFYCDTDSIFGRGLQGLEEGGLGAWKTDTIQGFQAKGPKFYKAGKNYTVKGVPKRVAKNYFVSGVASWKAPIKFRESFRGRYDLNQWVMKRRSVSKGLLSKRRRLGGGRTEPWEMAYRHGENVLIGG
jgi:hypothetical protein